MLKSQESSAVRLRPPIVRQALAAAFVALIFVSFGAPPKAEAATIDLTGDVWNVEGVDTFNNVWDGSTLVFETQVFNGTDYDLTGYFDWVGVGPLCAPFGGCSGRELFTGTLFSDLNFELTGVGLENPVNIVLGFYTAIVVDGLNIINGEWDGLFEPGVPSNDWSASRAGVSEVPLPAAAPLFASVLAGAFGWGAARRRTARS